MIEKIKYLFASSILLAVIGSFVACNNDNTGVDEWAAKYVYLERPERGVSNLNVNFKHSSLGLSGTVTEVPVKVCINSPATTDVTVNLAFAIDGTFPAEALSFVSGSDLTIAAGETSAEDILMINVDGAFADEALSSTVAVSIESIEPNNDAIRISTKQRDISVTVNKEEKCDITVDVVPAGAKLDRTDWIVWWQSSYDNIEDEWELSDKLTDDDGYSYHYTTPVAVKVDLGSVKTISGIESYCGYGSWYAPTSVEIFISNDGTTWENAAPAALDVAAAYSTYVSFIVPIEARFIRYNMHRGSSSCLISEIWVWSEE